MAANPDWPRIAALARMLSTLFVVAVVVNYLWELAQAPLFVGGDDFNAMSWHCFVASLGDGVLVLLMFGVGWLVLRSQHWFLRPGVRGYVLMFISGFAIAIAVEWIAVHVLQRWAYLPAMPRLPVMDIGIVPVVQLLALPPLIFRIVAARTSRESSA
jgi:hypothetical protein